MFTSKFTGFQVKSRLRNVGAIALLLASSFALAQEGPPPAHGALMGGHELRFLSRYLSLTEAQKAQVKQLLDGERSAASPLMQQAHQSHLQMTQLTTEREQHFSEHMQRQQPNDQPQTPNN